MSRPEREKPVEGGLSLYPHPDPARTTEEAARSRAAAELFLKLCRLACSNTPAKDIGQHFLKAVLDSLGIDRVAVLKHLPQEGSHAFEDSLGFPQSAQIGFHPPGPMKSLYFVTTENDPDPLTDSLRKAIGVQYILWVFDDKSGKSLLLGNRKQKTRLGFVLDESCRSIAEAALNLYLGISEKRWIEHQSGEMPNHVEKTTVQQAAEVERLDLLFHHTSDIILVFEADSTISYISRSIERILGYASEDMVGREVFDFIHSEDSVRVQVNYIRETMTAGVSDPVEFRVKHADGSWRHFEGVTNNLLEDPAVAGVVVNARDITKRKLLEEEREKLIHNMGDRVKELCCMYEVANSVRNHSNQEEIFMRVATIIPPGWQYPEIARGRVVFDGKEYVSEPFEETEWKQSSDIVVDGARRGSVEVFYLEECPELDEGPFLREERNIIDGIARTISEAIEHKHAGEALLASEEKYGELSNSITDVFFAMDQDLRCTYWNKACEDLTGTPAEDTIGKDILEIFPDDENTRIAISEYRNVLKTQKSQTFVNEIHMGGKTFFFEITAYPTMSGLSVFARDSTERIRANQQLRFSAGLLEIANRHTNMTPLLDDFVVQIRQFTDCSAVGIRMLDADGNISYRAYRGFPREFYERESPLSIHTDQGMCVRVITGDIDPKLSCFTRSGCFYVNGTASFLAEVSEEERESSRTRCNRFGYESLALIPIRSRSKILGLIHVADERTDVLPLEVVEVLNQAAMLLGEAIERVMAREAQDQAERRLEEQRVLSIASDRLRSLGEMAAGIAHELNQPLVGVRGLAEHIMIGLDRGWTFSNENIRKKVQLIVEQSERMTHIIDHVRVFAKEAGKPEVRRVLVNDVILSSTGLVNAQLRARGIELKSELTENLPHVLVNPFSLEEVILNLISNARDAVEEKMSRDPASTVAEILLRTREEGREPPGGNNRKVLIEVVDRGIGVSAENLPKVFDPFFTTKGPHRGTGLGLAVSKSIIEELSGTLEIRSELNRGTTITISLEAEPVARKTPEGKHE